MEGNLLPQAVNEIFNQLCAAYNAIEPFFSSFNAHETFKQFKNGNYEGNLSGELFISFMYILRSFCTLHMHKNVVENLNC